MNLQDILAGLNHLKSQPKWQNGQMHTQAFTNLCADLKTWGERNGKDDLETKHHQDVARMIWYTPALKLKFTDVGGKIGPYTGAALPPLVTTGPVTPKYRDLDTYHNGNSAEAVRSDVVKVLGITNKHHSVHGANNTGAGTLRSIIKDVIAPVTQGTQEWTRVQNVLRTQYPGYL